MDANDTPYPSLSDRLTDLEDSLYLISGFCAACRLISPELGMEARRPSTEAFWALLEGIDATAAACRVQSDEIHKAIKREAFK